MPPLFWLDVAAYGISTVIATALALMVLAAGFSHSVNRRFAAFAMAEAAWALFSLLMRISLWGSAGNPSLMLEMATFAFALMGPSLLMFAVRYVGRPARWADATAILGIAAVGALSVPLFRHQLVFNPYLETTGALNYDLTLWGILVAVLPAAYFLWALLLFWQERRRTGEGYMAASVLILLAGFVIGGIVRPDFPVMSFTVTLSVLVLGYGIVSRQLLNPLRELTVELEQRVEERTRELAEAAARLEAVNATLERRTIQMEAAARVARDAAAIRDVDQLLGETVRLISEQFGFYHAGIFLLDSTREYAVLRAASSEGGQRMLARGHRLRVGIEGIVGWVVGTGQPRVALNVGEDAVFFDNPDLPQTRSEMALPLKVRGEVIGALDVQSVEPAAFSDEDVAALQTMADQIALFIDNARLLEEAQEQVRQVSTLLGRQGREGWRLLAAERPSWGYVYDGIEVAPREAAEVEDVEPQLTVPLQAYGETIGRLNLVLPDRSPTPDDVAFIQAVAEHASLALENARLFQETQRTLRDMEALYRASRIIGEATSMQQIVRGAAEVAATLGFAACSLVLVTTPNKKRIPTHGDAYSVLIGEEEFVPIPPALDFPISDPVAARKVLEEPEFVLIYEDADDPQCPIVEEVREVMRNMGMRGMVVIGLAAGGRALGFLSFTSVGPLTGFSEERIRRIRTVADQVAIAVEGLRLLEQTQRRAERERLRAEISARVRASTEVDNILQTAIRELGRALRASDGLIRLETGDGTGSPAETKSSND